MPRSAASDVALGTGIYSRADAARLLQMEPGRLRRWVSGYTYWLRSSKAEPARRRQDPLVHGDLPNIGSAVALSFLELMELLVVKALIDRGLTLQYIRAAAAVARERFSTPHPFASQRLFTDGRAIFSAVSDDLHAPDLVKWSRRDIDQLVSGPILKAFVREADFDHSSKLAIRWWPRGKRHSIVLDPHVVFGAPTIAHTRVQTSTIAAYVVESSVARAAVLFELPEKHVQEAVAFEKALAAA